MREPPLFLDTPIPSPITEFVCQVTSNVDGDEHYASGTAVIIAPHLALSARHVFDEHWARHHGGPPPVNGEAAGAFSLVLAQLVGAQLNLWTVTRLWSSQLTDIVVFRLTPISQGAQNYTFRPMVIDLIELVRANNIAALNADRVTVGALPEIGTPTVAFRAP